MACTEDLKLFMYRLSNPPIIASYYLPADYHDFKGVMLIIRQHFPSLRIKKHSACPLNVPNTQAIEPQVQNDMVSDSKRTGMLFYKQEDTVVLYTYHKI